MIKPFSSLFAKIILCFFTNLVLVVAVLAGFIAFQARVDLHSILSQNASDRLRIAADLIAHDLTQQEQARWPDILSKHRDIYQVDFALVTFKGLVFTSPGLSIPEMVINRAKEARPKDPDFSSHHHKDHSQGQQSEENGRGSLYPQSEAVDKSGDTEPRLMLHTKNPTRYWTGIWISVPLNEKENMMPAMLLAGSDSITGNGFFFDPVPWFIAGGAVIIISIGLWIPLIRHITKPLGRMTRAAEEIARGRFDVAVFEQRRDEIGRLSGAIQHMTERLRGFVEGQKRFLRDVAHELGSPIARIQFGLGILEQHADRENQGRLADVTEDVAHMSNLVNELLSFSRAEMSPEKVRLTSVELLPVVQHVVRREGVSPETVIIGIDPQFRVLSNTTLLCRAIANIIRNAVKYGGQQQPIRISARQEKGVALIDIEDSGPGVPEEYITKIFEPFFRPETARDRESGGVGLGLSIVKTCMEACRGAVSARNLKPRGLSVTLKLPLPE